MRKRNKLTINTFALSGTLIPDFFYISLKYAFMRHGISLLLICLLVFLVCPGKVIPDIEIKPTQKELLSVKMRSWNMQ